MPLAFFCTLFFRHRKKSMNAPWDCKSHHPRRSRRVRPHREKEGLRLRAHESAFRSPFLEAFGPRKLRNLSPWGDISTTRAAVGASCSLTGSCFRQSCHVMPLAGGFPLAPCTPSVRPLKITPMGRQVPLPRPESARQAPPKNIPAPECPHKKAEAAHSAPLPLSHLFQGIKLPAPVDLPGEPLRHRPGDKVRRAADRLVLAERVRHGVDK